MFFFTSTLLFLQNRRKQEEENIQKFGRKVRTNRVTDGSFDPEKEVMEDIEGELEKYIELKEKLTAYLSYLNTREGADIKVADSNRLKYKVKNALSAKFGLNMDEDGEESAYYERKRKDMIGQLGKAMGGNKPRGDGAVRKNNFMS